MRVVERTVSAGDRPLFELNEFLARPLFAHLAHASPQGSRESPVWFHWDGMLVWIIGGDSFPANLKRDPRCAVGIVDFDVATGKCHHVGMRGTAEVLPFDAPRARAIFLRYFGPDEGAWDRRFDDVFTGDQEWRQIEVKGGKTYGWDSASTYVQNPPYFEGMTIEPAPVKQIGVPGSKQVSLGVALMTPVGGRMSAQTWMSAWEVTGGTTMGGDSIRVQWKIQTGRIDIWGTLQRNS